MKRTSQLRRSSMVSAVWVTSWLILGSFHQQAGADEKVNISKKRSDASSRAEARSSTPEATGKATAITRREGDNGSRVIQVIEDERMIRISARPRTGITVIIVEAVRDMEKVSRYSARTPESLKKKHPRSYEFYEKYAKAEPFVDDLADQSGKTLTDEQKWLAIQKRQQEQLEKLQQEFLQRRLNGFQSGTQSGFQRAMGFQSGNASSSARARASSSSSSSGRASSSGSSSSSRRQSGSSRRSGG